MNSSKPGTGSTRIPTEPGYSYLVAELFAALLGTVILSLNIPWGDLLSTATPGGGDNPAHPVLMRSVADALLQHGTIIHYNFKLWGGFELFQFYFPLPYVVGALLSLGLDSNVAYKIMTIIPLLLLPPAFYCVARATGASRILAGACGLLGIAFVHTRAHVMWGGNVSSTMAGMTGNTYGIALFLLALAAMLRSRKKHAFSGLLVLCGVLTISAHFYTFLMLAVAYGLFAFFELIRVWKRSLRLRKLLSWSMNGLATVGLMLWWILPLLYYRPFSADFGGDWSISLLQTFRPAEQLVFGLAIVVSLALLFLKRSGNTDDREALLWFGICFPMLFWVLFVIGTFTSSVAFSNIRLWPSIYLGLYLLLLILLSLLEQQAGKRWLPALLVPIALLIPDSKDLRDASYWMWWNYSGIEARESFPDFRKVIDTLGQLPPSRISFESNGQLNTTLGSVRVFEGLPYYLPQHEIVEGGIVNSATFPGIPYTLQCLMSRNCAGWPSGSMVPGQDLKRGADLARALGVQYHIASSAESRAAIAEAGEYEPLYEGSDLALYRLRGVSPMVEVFSGPPAEISTRDPRILLLSFPRYDRLRNSGVVFRWGETPDSDEKLMKLYNFLIKEWASGRRVTDRSVEDRFSNPERYLNSFLVASDGRRLAELSALGALDPFIGDRAYGSDMLYADARRYSASLMLPLVRDSEGEGQLMPIGFGYRLFQGDRELTLDRDNQVTFRNYLQNGSPIPFALIEIRPIRGAVYKALDVQTLDSSIRAGFPGEAGFELPERITGQCNVQLHTSFHRIELDTSCPGRPHLIKYSYYPKWRASVPISRGVNGFMMVTPPGSKLVLTHERAWIDWLGMALSAVTIVLILFSVWHGRKSDLA